MRTKSLLILLFILVLGIRLFMAFQTPYFSDEKAYFTFRQVENIIDTGKPIYYDNLSFEGKQLIFSPVYYYILAFFSLFMPLAFTLKVIPNVFASLLIFVVYALSLKISKSKPAAVFSSFLSGFVPVFFGTSINSALAFSLALPLSFLALYFFLDLRNKNSVYLFVITITFMAIFHPFSYVIILILLFYLALVKLEGLRVYREEIELIIFSSFLVLWLEFILYKKAFLFHGASLIWQNIPASILSDYFTGTSVPEAIYLIGIIPFIFGIYIIYRRIFRKSDKRIYLLFSSLLVISAFTWFKLLELKISLSFMGIVLVILFSLFYKTFFDYLKNTKVSRLRWLFVAGFVLVFLVTSVWPSIAIATKNVQAATTDGEMEALIWIGKNTPKDSVVLGTLYYGNLISAIAKRKNVIDSNFVLVKDPEKIYSDVREIYRTIFETEAISLLDDYNVDYIIFSDRISKELSIKNISYIDSDCFKKVYDNKIKIYKPLCVLNEN